MAEIFPRFVLVDIGFLSPAEWNYKDKGDRSQLTKLLNSLTRNRSYGSLAIRSIGDRFEVIDGNHRLLVLQEFLEMHKTSNRLAINLSKITPLVEVKDDDFDVFEYLKAGFVVCEDFGPISKSEAILISRRRNAQWFDDNLLSFAQLLKEEVVPEIQVDALELFMPDTGIEIRRMLEFVGLSIPDSTAKMIVNDDDRQSPDGYDTLKFTVGKEISAMWQQWVARLDLVQYKNEQARMARAFELALAEAINTPEVLQK